MFIAVFVMLLDSCCIILQDFRIVHSLCACIKQICSDAINHYLMHPPTLSFIDFSLPPYLPPYSIDSNGRRTLVNRNHLLLRGCVVRNTTQVIGIVVYAGKGGEGFNIAMSLSCENL